MERKAFKAAVKFLHKVKVSPSIISAHNYLEITPGYTEGKLKGWMMRRDVGNEVGTAFIPTTEDSLKERVVLDIRAVYQAMDAIVDEEISIALSGNKVSISGESGSLCVHTYKHEQITSIDLDTMTFIGAIPMDVLYDIIRYRPLSPDVESSDRVHDDIEFRESAACAYYSAEAFVYRFEKKVNSLNCVIPVSILQKALAAPTSLEEIRFYHDKGRNVPGHLTAYCISIGDGDIMYKLRFAAQSYSRAGDRIMSVMNSMSDVAPTCTLDMPDWPRFKKAGVTRVTLHDGKITGDGNQITGMVMYAPEMYGMGGMTISLPNMPVYLDAKLELKVTKDPTSGRVLGALLKHGPVEKIISRFQE